MFFEWGITVGIRAVVPWNCAIYDPLPCWKSRSPLFPRFRILLFVFVLYCGINSWYYRCHKIPYLRISRIRQTLSQPMRICWPDIIYYPEFGFVKCSHSECNIRGGIEATNCTSCWRKWSFQFGWWARLGSTKNLRWEPKGKEWCTSTNNSAKSSTGKATTESGGRLW